MKKLLFSIAIMALSSNLFAQKTLWLHNTDRMSESPKISLEGIDSISFKPKYMKLFKNDGTSSTRTYSTSYDYYTFKHPERYIYKPAELKSMDFNDSTSQWCWNRSKESEHFIIFWDNGYNEDPSVAMSGSSAHFNPDELLENAEYFYKMYTDSLKFCLEGESPSIDDRKIEIFVNSSSTWLATGSGYDDKIGALWCNYNAVNSKPTLAHEIGHSFQYMVACNLGTDHGWRYGFGDNASGGCGWWESCAQWQAYRCYPGSKFNEYFSYDYFYLNLLHEDWRYYNHFIQDYWAMRHGADFIGKMWRESVKPEDPIETYKRMAGIDQTTFNDEIYDYASRSVTWDIDGIRDLGTNHMDHKTIMNLADETNHTWQVSSNWCPQNYGYNVIPLTLRPTGTQISADFKGIAGADGYRAINVDKAGWRYGFVALASDGTRTYSDTYSANEGKADFTVPANATNLWFVVSGAPTEHWRHAWDDDTSNDEQWPYQVKFSNTDLPGYFVDSAATAKDTTIYLTTNLQYKTSGTAYAIASVNKDILAQNFAISSSDLSGIGNKPENSLCTFGVDADGTRTEGTTSNMYCFYADGTLHDYDDSDTNMVLYVAYINYFGGFYIIMNSKNPNIKIGDSYTNTVGIRYNKDGKNYYATYVVTVNIVE